MERYYLTQLPDGTWQITHQITQDSLDAQQVLQTSLQADIPVIEVTPPPAPTVWVDDTVQGTYDTWQEAIGQVVDAPITFDPQPDWPEELGGGQE